jgi:hypothetical protein
LLNTINDMRYGAGPDGLHFDATTVDLFLTTRASARGAAVYRFTLRYPRTSPGNDPDIDGNNGVLLPTDVAVYLRKVYLAKLLRKPGSSRSKFSAAWTRFTREHRIPGRHGLGTAHRLHGLHPRYVPTGMHVQR